MNTEHKEACAEGHNFQPRYDTIPMSFDCRGGLGSVFTEIHHKRIYVHDICGKCGTVIRRDAQ